MAKKEINNSAQVSSEENTKTSEAMQAEALMKELEEQKAEKEALRKELQEQQAQYEQEMEKLKKQQEELKQKEKEPGEGDKTVKKSRRSEAKRKRGEDAKGAEEKKKIEFRKSADKMSDKVEKLVSDDIKTMKRKEKTRSMEMLGIFAKHGFYANGMSPVELRTTLEDLGPTYVKIGQIMSSRSDMLPEEYCKELGKLRESVQPMDSNVARAVIEQELGKPIKEIFKDFNDKPLGSASIGQAHSATLLDGTKVVVKVQRPLVAETMRNDFAMLKKLASSLSAMKEQDEDEDKKIDLLGVIEEMEKVEDEELDFRIEARNTIYFKENCIPDESVISCPSIYPDMTTERVMTMTFVDGYSVSKRDRVIADGYDPNTIGSIILDNYMYQVLEVGTFHADPHQGNIMISQGKPYWIDFGMLGHLSSANIKCIQDVVLSVINTDTEDMVNAIMSMGAASPKTDRAKLTEDVEALLKKYYTVTNLDELDLSALLTDISDIMGKHHITMPSEYTMLVRSVSAMEGVLEELAPELNLFDQIVDRFVARMRKNFDLKESVVGLGKDAIAITRKAARLPTLAADVLTGITKGRAKINLELVGYEPIMDQIDKGLRTIVYACFACVIFFGSCLLCLTDIQPKTAEGMPIVAVFGFIFSIALGIYTIKKAVKKK